MGPKITLSTKCVLLSFFIVSSLIWSSFSRPPLAVAVVTTTTKPGDGHDHDQHETVKQSTSPKEKGHDHDDDKPGSHEPTGHEKHDDHDHDGSEKKETHLDGGEHGGGKKDEHGHEEENKVALTSQQMNEFAITIQKAKSGSVETQIIRPAEIKFDQDRIVHVIPRVDGTVKSVFVSEGEYIKKGALMAILDSRELADAKAEYLAAMARFQLSKENLERDSRLSRRKILAEKQFLDTRTKHVEAQIARRVATQKLRALGMSSASIRKLPKADDDELSLFSIRAPFSGLIIERHMVVGETRSVDKEALTSRKAAFIIADISKVWIDISIYPKDFKTVKKGQRVTVLLEDGGSPVTGKIAFVSPHILEATRTGFARAILDNSSRRFHPGTYLKARISTSSHVARVRIPKQAVQTSEHGKIVFVKEGNGFTPREIELGEENHQFVEVKSGLSTGETYVSTGAFTLKAQLGKAAFGDGHNH